MRPGEVNLEPNARGSILCPVQGRAALIDEQHVSRFRVEPSLDTFAVGHVAVDLPAAAVLFQAIHDSAMCCDLIGELRLCQPILGCDRLALIHAGRVSRGGYR